MDLEQIITAYGMTEPHFLYYYNIVREENLETA